ncbi:MAG: hypothetical protein Kapaf2KO_20010 [Candidatus Kapaibacteriales bacterium]
MLSLFFIVFAYDALDDVRIEYEKKIVIFSLLIATIFIYDQSLGFNEVILALPFMVVFFQKTPPFLLFIPYLTYRLL